MLCKAGDTCSVVRFASLTTWRYHLQNFQTAFSSNTKPPPSKSATVGKAGQPEGPSTWNRYGLRRNSTTPPMCSMRTFTFQNTSLVANHASSLHNYFVKHTAQCSQCKTPKSACMQDVEVVPNDWMARATADRMDRIRSQPNDRRLRRRFFFHRYWLEMPHFVLCRVRRTFST